MVKLEDEQIKLCGEKTDKEERSRCDNPMEEFCYRIKIVYRMSKKYIYIYPTFVGKS
jgi:hypothetical protein